jgi:hypothetical protein
MPNARVESRVCVCVLVQGRLSPHLPLFPAGCVIAKRTQTHTHTLSRPLTHTHPSPPLRTHPPTLPSLFPDTVTAAAMVPRPLAPVTKAVDERNKAVNNLEHALASYQVHAEPCVAGWSLE